MKKIFGLLIVTIILFSTVSEGMEASRELPLVPSLTLERTERVIVPCPCERQLSSEKICGDVGQKNSSPSVRDSEPMSLSENNRRAYFSWLGNVVHAAGGVLGGVFGYLGNNLMYLGHSVFQAIFGSSTSGAGNTKPVKWINAERDYVTDSSIVTRDSERNRLIPIPVVVAAKPVPACLFWGSDSEDDAMSENTSPSFVLSSRKMQRQLREQIFAQLRQDQKMLTRRVRQVSRRKLERENSSENSK